MTQALAVLGVGTCAAIWLGSSDYGDAALPGGSNGLIAFMSNRNTDYDILVMQPSPGSSVTDLTSSTDGGRNDGNPTWTGDGQRILFDSARQASTLNSDDVHVMGANGSAPTPLTETQASEVHGSTSASGTKIAFRSTLTGAEDIYVMDRDGSNETPIASDPAVDTDPVMSPDGTRIAFMSRRDGGEWDIFSVSTSGTALSNLTFGSASDDLEPDWSPDGSRIAFASGRSGGDLDIFTMNADGSDQKPLLDNTASDGRPAWSPDGTKIAFHSNMDGNFEIYVLNADGSGAPTRLTNNPANDLAPSWQPLPAAGSPPPPVPPPPPPEPTPTVLTARLAYNFSFRQGAGVTLNRFSVFDVKRGSTVVTRCLRGCSVRKRTTAIRAGVNLQPLFRGKRLRIPMTVEVRVTRPGLFVGRYLKLDITRRAGRVRSRVTECRIAYPTRKVGNCRRI